MAIATYSDLTAALSDWLARADISAPAADFVTLAEARLNRALRAQEMQATVTTAITAGAVALPADYIEWLSVRWVGTRTQDLTFVEPDSPEWRFRYRPTQDPSMFTVMAGSFEIRPVGTGNLKVYYFQKIPPLASNATNWLLTKSPDIYLYTSLAEAHIYMKDETRAGDFLGLAKAEVESQSIAADSGKLDSTPGRFVDTGTGNLRAGNPPSGGAGA